MENDKNISYTTAVSRLEEIVAQMQNPECDIDALSGYTAEALRLLKLCKEKLFKTDEEVKRCLEELK